MRMLRDADRRSFRSQAERNLVRAASGQVDSFVADALMLNHFQPGCGCQVFRRIG